MASPLSREAWNVHQAGLSWAAWGKGRAEGSESRAPAPPHTHTQPYEPKDSPMVTLQFCCFFSDTRLASVKLRLICMWGRACLLG